jgi:flagellum-specific ATP synthase
MTAFELEVERLVLELHAPEPSRCGVVTRLVGLRLETSGLVAPLGACCEVTGVDGQMVDAEVVGFQGSSLLLMPFTEPQGIGPGSRVRVTGQTAHAALGQALLGRVIDARGRPLDGRPPPQCSHSGVLQGDSLNPMERGPIREVLDVGVRAINGMLTMGRGQRIGLVAGSGVGKSVLLGMMTRYTEAEIVVIGLVGERGREVQAFINESLGPQGLAKSVVIAAPANVSPVLRLKAAQLTHRIAEHFRDQGRHVLMLVDSLTRVAHAQREVGLAIGEPPTAKGYPPSVFALLPMLIERGGPGRRGHGSITSVYTVLAEGDDGNDPIVDIARASLDGQVMLSRRLADASHYPAIDLMGSISRAMPQLLAPEDLERANRFRRLWTLYQQSQDLIQVGAYESGSNRDLDLAIKLRPALENYLRQDMNAPAPYAECREALKRLLGG